MIADLFLAIVRAEIMAPQTKRKSAWPDAISITNYGCNCRSRIIEFSTKAGSDYILDRTHER